MATMNFVDLAGSERTQQVAYEEGSKERLRQKEVRWMKRWIAVYVCSSTIIWLHSMSGAGAPLRV